MIERYYQKCPHCGRNAFEYLERPVSGQVMRASDIKHLKNPKPGNKIDCQHCGGLLLDRDFNQRNLIVEIEATMNYELALELRKNNFPYSGGYYIDPSGMTVTGAQTVDRLDVGYIPTLSELIEACDSTSHFISIGRAAHSGEEQWEAKIENFDLKTGLTPEIALARLWLELNAKMNSALKIKATRNKV